MDNYQLELTEDSKRIDEIKDINIVLKEHQRAMINKCIEIENNNICNLGIMSDKPGTGKTYAILGLIYYSQKKSNIIVVPQNIILQWCESINYFSNGKLKYKKFINYNDILDLYNVDTKLFDYDILLTTSLYYNLIATTMQSNFLNVERVFLDEIDSISSFIVNKINANFIWFVSASFNYEEMGIYTTEIDKLLIPYITCKCNDDFINNTFNLDKPNIYKIICKNIYLDHIFNGLVSNDEFKLLNAMDYSKLKKKFCNKIAQNEKEAIDYLVKDKIDIIEIEEIRINDINKMLENIVIEERKNILNKQLEKSKKSLEESKYKLNLIRDRLKDNNCCPLCYNEFDNYQIKLVSPCCKNTICYTCTNNWFNNMKKKNCIYCNIENINYSDYVIIKSLSNDICLLCDKEYVSIDDKYYSNCCKKNCCLDCLKDWYYKLLKNNCLFCTKDEILYEDFKNEKQHEEVKLNTQSGIKYTKKTKIEFIEYFIKTKIYSNCKIIFCSNYIRIFNDIKKLFIKYNIKYIELDDGNIDSINDSIQKYIYGNINVLLLNSNLFGCGLNLECTTDIVFLHKTETTLEKQIIGRAQRLGRKNALNIWYIMHENEKIITTKKNKIIYNNNTYNYTYSDEYSDEYSDKYSYINDENNMTIL
jgi:hypothetical protein